MKKEEKEKEVSRRKFDFSLDDTEEVKEPKDIGKTVDELTREVHTADETARRFDEVVRNPVKPDFMKTELYEAEDNLGNKYVAMPHDKGEIDAKDKDGEDIKVTLYDPIFVVDLKTQLDGQVAECPITVIPTILDEKLQMEMNERREFKPEKPKKEFNWYWVILVASFVPAVIWALWMFWPKG